MNILLAGATGQLGTILRRHFSGAGHPCHLLTRDPDATEAPCSFWDGRTPGPWRDAIDGADIVINLAGRSVNCRYTEKNLAEMRASRVDSTRAIGAAIAAARKPPRVWLQMSTATIYAHRYDAPNDDVSGRIGGGEPGAPRRWDRSIEIAQAWEQELACAATPRTRKVALRTAMVMSPDRGGVFDTLATLARFGLGGTAGGGRQYVSWIHEADFIRAVEFLIHRDDLEGAVNLASPHPLPNIEFQRILRQELAAPFGIPSPAWLLEAGAMFLRTDTELIMKSRRVIPTRLLDAGFIFNYGAWEAAVRDVARRWRGRTD